MVTKVLTVSEVIENARKAVRTHPQAKAAVEDLINLVPTPKKKSTRTKR